MVSAPNIILLVFSSLAPVLVLVGAILFVWYFQAEEDKWKAWIPKIVVVIAMSFGVISIFLIPFDVANFRISQVSDPLVVQSDLDYALGITFQVFYGICIFFLIFILPFVIFFYETEDPEQPVSHQIKWASIYSVVIAIFALTVILVLYFTIGRTDIPVTNVTANVFVNSLEEAKLYRCLNDRECSRNTIYLSFNVQFIVYVVALVNTFGWLVFLLLGGCGLWSLPIELIKSFIYRPRRLKSDEFIVLKDQVMRKTEKMIELGNKIQEAKDEGKFKGRKNQQLLKDFRESTLALEDHWNVVQTSFYAGGGKIILPFVYLFLGIICAMISLVWILQIILWLVVPRGYNFGFLNYLLYYSDFIFEFLPFIGTILYSIFTIYLIICIMAGAMKIARQIPFLSVHPLKPHNTMMNSLLFNSGLFLVASLTVSQFAADAFSQYISSTVLDTMYNGVIKNLFLLNYFYMVINYILLGFGVVGMILSVIFARNKTKDEKQLEAVIQKLLATE